MSEKNISNRVVGYGVSVRNNKCEDVETVAFQELRSLMFSESDIYVDVVRSDDSSRPKLEYLIENLGYGDGITMYSIDALLTGNCNKGIEYYKQILDKQISIVIYDLSGRIAKLSKFTRYFYDEAVKIYGEKNCDELVDELKEYANNVKLESKKRSMRKIDITDLVEYDKAFIEIYFAYEAYQIDLPTTLELLRNYCNIKSEITFRNIAMAYEGSVDYDFAFDLMSGTHKDILHLPKRTGSIPEEFYQIKTEIDRISNDEITMRQKIPESMIFESVVKDLYIKMTYPVYYRWKLLYNKVPKPRKPIGATFKVEEFKRKFTPINEKEGDND